MSTSQSNALGSATAEPRVGSASAANRTDGGEALDRIVHILKHAAHLLPAQGPITVFVHHNTLHAFEELPFEKAVLAARDLYDCNAYLPENRFRSMLVSGRIRPEDLKAVLVDDLQGDANQDLEIGGTRMGLRLAMLRYPLCGGTPAELGWLLAETNALTKFRPESPEPIRRQCLEDTRRWVMRDLIPNPESMSGHLKESIAELEGRFGLARDWDDSRWEAASLDLLWHVVRHGVRVTNGKQQALSEKASIRKALLRITEQDTDELLDEVLIPYCAAFLDQGFANWPLPERDAGFFGAFLRIFGENSGYKHWMQALPAELKRIERAQLSPLESIRESLDLLGIEEDEWDSHLTRTVHALRGFAGMIWQMETNAEWTVRPAPAGTLLEYLAVRLVLERVAIRHLAKALLNPDGDLTQLREQLARSAGDEVSHKGERRAFELFQLAQVLGWSPSQMEGLTAANWSNLIAEVECFSSLERQRIYQLAFERRYRNQALDAVLAHSSEWLPASKEVPVKAAYQAILCLDDREESLRRHLEEVDPDCETFGVAGFFGVAMYYRGVTEAHYRPLCPVNIKPQHYVQEESVYSLGESSQRRAQIRRNFGRAAHTIHSGTRTLAGGVLTGLLGSLATIPLVLRVLSPRSVAIARKFVGTMVTPPVTRLMLERTEEPEDPKHREGYSLDEMIDIVEGGLRGIGLISDFAELVLAIGHGSSSLNNPHSAAYDCGACGGGKGGPNGRAFAEMANDVRVREALAKRGITIPDDVMFLGAYHNTCDDSMTYYDLDRLPLARRAAFERARKALDEARQRDAHERCRRFVSAPLSLTAEEALQHVEGRAEDLSQTRSECGHATNALCFVGRRSWSRGMYLDRRTFLTSYNPEQDDVNSSILKGLLRAVIPVCAGINLEYYFSFVDPIGYGC